MNPDYFLEVLAEGVTLFRNDPDATEQKRAVLGTLTALCPEDGIRLGFDGKTLTAQGRSVRDDLPGREDLIHCLQRHGIQRIDIGPQAGMADLMLLLQALGSDPTDWVPIPEGGSVTVVDDGVAHGDGPTSAPEVSARAPTEAPKAADASLVAEAEKLAAGVKELAERPYEGNTLGRLSAIVQEAMGLLKHLEYGPALYAMKAVIDLEKGAPDGSARRHYGIAVRRMLTHDTLTRVISALPDPRYFGSAAVVLIRAGIPGAEILVKQMEVCRDIDECRACVEVLKEFPEAAGMVAPLVRDVTGYVAAGAAELLGEYRYEQGVEALAEGFGHPDTHVRQAATRALASIGTVPAVEHIQRALMSSDQALRRAVVQGVHGRRSSALAMPLLKVAHEKGVELDVVRDCYQALARIGTPTALQALLEATQAGGRLIGKRPPATRAAAVEALASFDLPLVKTRLMELAGDRSDQVRGAARAALEARPRPG